MKLPFRSFIPDSLHDSEVATFFGTIYNVSYKYIANKAYLHIFADKDNSNDQNYRVVDIILPNASYGKDIAEYIAYYADKLSIDDVLNMNLTNALLTVYNASIFISNLMDLLRMFSKM